MTITYTAIDGKIFTDKETRLRYERALKKEIAFQIMNPRKSYESFTLKKDEKNENETLYIEHWDGDYREGGCDFNGILQEIFKDAI